MKKCPFCAEEIQDEAIKCRYCGSTLDKAKVNMVSGEVSLAKQVQKSQQPLILSIFIALLPAIIMSNCFSSTYCKARAIKRFCANNFAASEYDRCIEKVTDPSSDISFGKDCSVFSDNDRGVSFEAWFSFILALAMFSYMFYNISTTRGMWRSGIIFSIVILFVFSFFMIIPTVSSVYLYVILIIILVIIFVASRVYLEYDSKENEGPSQHKA